MRQALHQGRSFSHEIRSKHTGITDSETKWIKTKTRQSKQKTATQQLKYEQK